MKTHSISTGLLKALIAMLFMFSLVSCGGSKHATVENKNWINWTITFQQGTSEHDIKKTLTEIENSIQEQVNKEGPPATINFHTIIRNERFVMLNAGILQASNAPKPKTGGPHIPPDAKSFIKMKHIENIATSTGEFGG